MTRIEVKLKKDGPYSVAVFVTAINEDIPKMRVIGNEYVFNSELIAVERFQKKMIDTFFES